MYKKLLLVSTCLILIIVWSDPSSAQRKRPNKTVTETIDGQINDSDPLKPYIDITARSTSHGCQSANNPGRGCIRTTKGDAADMVFKMKRNMTCESGDLWVFTQFRLGGYSVDGSVGKPKKEADWGKLPVAVAADFRANPATGVADFTILNKRSIRVHNRNDGAYTVWYELTAECDGKKAVTDPRIKNTGKT
jgi:hypothetical protein